MNWLLLTLISVFVVSIANILQRVLMKDDKSNPYSYAIVFHFLIAILNLIFALLFGFQPLPVDGKDLILFPVAALLWGGVTIFLFKALQLLESSEVVVLTSVRALITVAASIIFLHESFNLQKIIGTTIILASILLVTMLKKGIRFNKGVAYSFTMAFFAGLALVVDAYNVKHYDVISYNAIVNFLIGFILLISYPGILREWKQFTTPSFLKRMLPLGLFSAVQANALYLAFASGGNASQIGPIIQAQVIVTVLLAVIFLNERDHIFRKLLAAALVTLGVILLT